MHSATAKPIPPALPDGCRPARARFIEHQGSAWVFRSRGDDFDPDDLSLVRRHFPGRHVTLDGDTITVWPHPRGTR
ncbi:hypothetical protein ACFV16_30770 [Streptomyces massasporeus]|uniref:hypothetical protein n=1 Tax=Streptomyces massasporeus TaxID=67324 RepID=UPI0036BC7A10